MNPNLSVHFWQAYNYPYLCICNVWLHTTSFAPWSFWMYWKMREKTVRYIEISKVEIFWELGIQSTFIIRPIPFLYYLLHLCTFSHHRVRCSKAPLQYSAMCITKFIFKFTLLFEVMQYSTKADCNGEDFFHFVIQGVPTRSERN